jgi:hypothetical protein
MRVGKRKRMRKNHTFRYRFRFSNPPPPRQSLLRTKLNKYKKTGIIPENPSCLAIKIIFNFQVQGVFSFRI